MDQNRSGRSPESSIYKKYPQKIEPTPGPEDYDTYNNNEQINLRYERDFIYFSDMYTSASECILFKTFLVSNIDISKLRNVNC